MELLKKTLLSIEPGNKKAAEEAKSKIDSLAKPLGSLGKLEDIVIRMAAMTGNVSSPVDKRNIIVMCADNGIVEEEVSTAPQQVTAIMTRAFTRGITGVCVLAKHAASDITVVDIGVKGDVDVPGVKIRKISEGTSNMAKGPAMTREDAERGIETGIEIVNEVINKGYNLIGTGEMGIGNTSTSSTVAAVLSGCSIEKMVGKGAGLTDEQHEHKKNILKKAIEVNKPDAADPIDVLAKVGGLDIAGLAGCFLGAAARKVPVVIDGFISSVAALVAYRLNKESRDYMIASHLSAEPGARLVMEELGLQPMLHMDMRLGEGTGCALAFHMISAAEDLVKHMATFDDIMLDNNFLVDIR